MSNTYQELSDKHRLVLDFIKSEYLEKGYPPSVREICAYADIKSTSTAHAYLAKLEDAGYIRRDPTKPRAILITDDSFINIRHEMLQVPIVGRVAAGEPILATENIEDYFPIPQDYVPNGNLFMLRVKGDSMINAGILPDDLVLVKEQNTAVNGDKVVALIEDGATVKTFYKEKSHIRLQPENDRLSPILLDDVTILGKVVGLYRQNI